MRTTKANFRAATVTERPTSRGDGISEPRGSRSGLCGRAIHVHHLNEIHKVIAFHRWDKGGPQDDVVVVANFSSQPHYDYQLGFPSDGVWKLRFNSDRKGYSSVFGNDPSTDAAPAPDAYDGHPCSAKITIAPYSVLIYSQDAKARQGKPTRSASDGITANRAGGYSRSASRQAIPSLTLRVRKAKDRFTSSPTRP